MTPLERIVVFREKVLGMSRNVSPTLPEGGKRTGHHVQRIEQVFAEAPLLPLASRSRCSPAITRMSTRIALDANAIRSRARGARAGA